MPVGGKGVENYLGAADSRDAGSTQSSAYVAPKIHRCPDARSAVPYYRFYTHLWQTARGVRLASGMMIRGHTCGYARFAAKEWRARAQAARQKYKTWLTDEWNWEAWLPDKWARIGACETGYGKRPGNWSWDSGTYVSAFGIYRPAYKQFAAIAGVPHWDAPGVRTPREQYEVALAIWRRYGFSGWGCRSA